VDAVIADLRGLPDKIAGIKERATEQLQQHKRKRTRMTLEHGLQELSDTLRSYEAKKEQKKLTVSERPGPGRGPSPYVRSDTQQGVVVHPVGVIGCDGSTLSANGRVSFGSNCAAMGMGRREMAVPKWQPEWGPEKQFCACESFREWYHYVDTQDLLYSALCGVEGALKALSGSGDDTSSLRRRLD